MIVSIIGAMAENRVIGKAQALPWHIPSELQYFKKMTMGKPMIMGFNTFESIGRRLLPGRDTIILTTKQLEVPGAKVANSIQAALDYCQDAEEVMVVGGAAVYQQFMEVAQRLYLSIIPGNYEGDSYFPEYEATKWRLLSEQNLAEFSTQILERRDV